MARGKSGRIVLEINPLIKRNLYLALGKNETTLKDWFIEAANNYITSNLQTPFNYIGFVADSSSDIYSTDKGSK